MQVSYLFNAGGRPRRRGFRDAASCLALTAALILPAAVQAATPHWTGAVSGDWSDPNNWDTGTVPTGTDNSAVVDQSSPNAARISGVTVTAPDLAIGFSGAASLNIDNGGVLNGTTASIGVLNTSANSAVSLDGVHSTWTNSGDLHIGAGGSGTVSVTGGAGLSNVDAFIGDGVGSSGRVSIDGAGSTWTNTGDLAVGNQGAGELDVRNGAAVTLQAGNIGLQTGSSGTVVIDGAGSTWTSQVMNVGYAGTGDMTVSSGGVASATFADLGSLSGANGTVRVDGSGSSLLVVNGLTIGGLGTGTVRLTNGGTVQSSGIVVGDQAGGVGTLTLDGAGTSASTTGSSSIYVGSAGRGSLAITRGATVTSANLTIGDLAGGKGLVTIDGAGSALTLTGSVANGAGSLAIGNGGDGTLQATNGAQISAGSTFLAILPSVNGTLALDGAGTTLTTGSLVIGGYGNGSMTITNGAVATSALGAIAFAAHGAMSVDGQGSTWTVTQNLYVGYGQGGVGTLSVANGGVVSSAGPVVIANQAGSQGTLAIGALSGAPAAPGTLNAPAVTFGPGSGTLQFNHTGADYVFAPAISGAGAIVQMAGATRLTGDSSGFTGQTSILGGRLSVDGSLANSAVSVGAGGTLGGRGVTGAVSAASGSTLAPGDSIGVLTVNGALGQAAGSTYRVELTSTGQSDRIDVKGAASIAPGATLDVVKLDAAPYVPDVRYTVLTAAGGVSGSYALTGDIQVTAFIDLILRQDANDIYLDTVKARSFSDVARTRNQRATAGALDALASTGGGATMVVAAANLQTDVLSRAAFDQLSGEIHASAKTALLEDSRFLREAAVGRVRSASGSVSAAPDREPGGVSAWGQAFGDWGHTDSDGDAAKLDRSASGFFMGADAPVSGWRVGGEAGYSRTTLKASDVSSSGVGDNYHLGAYGGGQAGPWGVRLGGGYSWRRLSVSRTPAFSGFSDRLSSHYGAGTAQAFGEIGYGLTFGPVSYEPFAGVAHVSLGTGDFRETGGAAALTVEGDTAEATFSELGLRAATRLAMAGGAADLHGELGWRHAEGDILPSSRQAFAGGSAFTVYGAPIARDGLRAGAGLEVDLAGRGKASLQYQGQIASHAQDHAIEASISWRF